MEIDLTGYIEITPQVSYNRFQCLGGGNFGRVYQGWHDKRKIPIAVKHITPKILGRLEGGEKREIEILERLRHPNVMEYYGCHYNKDGLFLFLEYCQKGNLANYLGKHRVSEKQALDLIKQLVSAMAYVNEQGFFHRDLKPDNILLTKDNVLKVADFGNARFKESLKDTFQKCTPIYSAPEVYLLDQYKKNDKKYSENCDVFSSGYILYELLTGEQITKGLTNHEELGEFLRSNSEHGFKLDHPSLTPKWIALLSQMLDFNPKTRPTFSKVLPQIQKLIANSDSPRLSRPVSEQQRVESAKIFNKIKTMLSTQEKTANYLINCLKILFSYQQQQSQLIPRVYKLLCLYFSLARYCKLSSQGLSFLHNPDSIQLEGFTLEKLEKHILPTDKAELLKFIDAMAARVNKGIQQIRSLMIKQIIPEIESILRMPADNLERRVLEEYKLTNEISNFREEQYATDGQYSQHFRRCVNNLFLTRAETEILSDSDLKIYLVLLSVSSRVQTNRLTYEEIKGMDRGKLIPEINKLKPT